MNDTVKLKPEHYSNAVDRIEMLATFFKIAERSGDPLHLGICALAGIEKTLKEASQDLSNILEDNNLQGVQS